MYTSYYAMSCNPFLKDESIKYPFASEDYKQTIERFRYLTEIKGIGLFVGNTGLGKTYVIRSFIEKLNKDLYKILYISANQNMNLFNFLKTISDAFGLDIGSCYYTNIYKNIQKEIQRIVMQERRKVILFIDDAHLLKKNILNNFKILYDFEMDSKDYVTLILVGNPELKQELSKIIYEPLKQRILVNYTFMGLSREEVKEYVMSRLNIANASSHIFTQDALHALYACCKSSPRRLNTLVINCLMLGSQRKKATIDSEIVMDAKKEMEV